jgi:hypothetical protein
MKHTEILIASAIALSQQLDAFSAGDLVIVKDGLSAGHQLQYGHIYAVVKTPIEAAGYSIAQPDRSRGYAFNRDAPVIATPSDISLVTTDGYTGNPYSRGVQVFSTNPALIRKATEFEIKRFNNYIATREKLTEELERIDKAFRESSRPFQLGETAAADA